MNRVNERLSMNDPRHYQETHDFCQETKKKSKSRNLLQQRLDETIGKSIKEEKQRKIPSPFFLKEESLTDQEASLEETEKDSKFVWENDLEIKELETAYKEESAEKRYRRLTQGVNLLIILLCIYTGFLIFGVAVTQYHYSDNGTIEAQKLSVSDIREKKEYEKILAQYINLRTIYQSVLLLDYQYDQNADEHMTIATEYEKILDDILKASTQIKALDGKEIEDYSLSTLIRHLGLDSGITFHQADDDVLATWRLMEYCYNEYKELRKTQPSSLEHVYINSIYFWKGYNKFQQGVYLNTSLGKMYYSTFQKAWFSSNINLERVDIDAIEREVLIRMGIDSNKELGKMTARKFENIKKGKQFV